MRQRQFTGEQCSKPLLVDGYSSFNGILSIKKLGILVNTLINDGWVMIMIVDQKLPFVCWDYNNHPIEESRKKKTTTTRISWNERGNFNFVLLNLLQILGWVLDNLLH